MTLSDLTDPVKLAEWLGLTEEQLRADYLICNPFEKSWYGRTAKPMKDSADFARMTLADLVKWWMGQRRDTRKLPYPFGERTHTQFIQECLRSLGLTKGTVEAKRTRAIELFPQFYQAPPAPEPSPVSWMHGQSQEYREKVANESAEMLAKMRENAQQTA